MKMHTKVLVHCIGLEHRGSFLPFQRVATSISTYLWVSPAVFPGFSCLWCGQMLCQDWSLFTISSCSAWAQHLGLPVSMGLGIASKHFQVQGRGAWHTQVNARAFFFWASFFPWRKQAWLSHLPRHKAVSQYYGSGCRSLQGGCSQNTTEPELGSLGASGVPKLWFRR